MKRIFTIAAALMMTASVWAQAPEKMSYQAVIRDASNALVTTQGVGIQVSILQGGATGNPVFVETHNINTNANGLVSLEIGTGSVVSGDFTTIDWANNTYFIKTETDPTTAGGSNYTITGTSQLMSVPYALHSKTAESITGAVNYTETDPVYTASEATNITATDITNLSNLSGVNTGDQDGSETKVTAGTNVTVTGTGTTASPYVVNTTNSLTVSQTGDTLTISGGNSVLVPGISLLNFPPPPAVGDNFEGGVIAYILQAGDPGYDANVTHGLIAAPTDQSSAIFWHVTNTGTTNATAAAIGTGAANTALIIALYGTEVNAAKLCTDLVIGIYSDWYLPSIDELQKLYNNRVAIGGFDTSANLSAYYWSSTEYTSTVAFYFRFFNGSASNFTKGTTLSVRAVRAF